MNHSSNIIEVFDQILNIKLMQGLAHHHKFIQRSTSKLKGDEFIKVMILPAEGVAEDSLSGLCSRIRNFNPDADLSPQALCERINKVESVFLMKDVFARILNFTHKKLTAQSPSLLKTLGHFNSIKIQDSTVIKLNTKIKKYQGCNRNGKKTSEMKIDVIHELLSNSLIDVLLESRSTPDQSLSERILKFVEIDDLIIRDLGYFSLAVLKTIIHVGAYFVSRMFPNIKVYLNPNDKKPIDLEKYVKRKCKKTLCIELQAFLGDLKVPARLILHKAPAAVVKIRYREAKKVSRDTGRRISNGKKFTMNFTCFITNVPAEILSAEMIGTIYQLRWEIELIFKRWKSLLKMNFAEGINEHRIETLMWGRLCTVLLLSLVSQEFGKLAEQFGKELSDTKVIKYILREGCFARAVQNNQLEMYIDRMRKYVSRMLCKDIRKRKTMQGRVIHQQGFYGAQAADFQYVA